MNNKPGVVPVTSTYIDSDEVVCDHGGSKRGLKLSGDVKAGLEISNGT